LIEYFFKKSANINGLTDSQDADISSKIIDIFIFLEINTENIT